jgi:hypothetical protein
MKPTTRCAFTNVGIIDLERDECRTGQTVFVADGRIAAIGSSGEVSLPPDVLRIDGSGRFIAPGLADMHAHPFSAEDLAVYLAAGVTTIRSMWGEASLLQLRREVEAGERPGPRIVTGGRLVCGSPPYFFGTTGIAEPGEVPDVVAAHVRDGYDFVKIYEKLSRPAFDAVAHETRRQGTRFAGHVPREVPLRHAMQSGMRSAEHLFGYLPAAQLHPECVHLERWFMADFADAVRNFEAIGRGERRIEDEIAPGRIDELAALAAANDFWTVPTLVVLRSIVGRTAFGSDHPQVRYMAPSTADAWAATQKRRAASYSSDFYRGFDHYYALNLQLLDAFHRAGAGILAGTDAPNPGVVTGFAIVDEIEYLREAGLTTTEALRTAMSAPASFLDRVDEFGAVREGLAADLLLLDADPRVDLGTLRRPLGVMNSGTWRDRPALDALLKSVEERRRAQADDFRDAPALARARRAAFRSSRDTRLVIDYGPNDAKTPHEEPAGWSRTGTDGWQSCVPTPSTGGGALSPLDLFACVPSLRDLPIHGSRIVTTPTATQDHAWVVTREPDTVVDSAFYYEGVRVYAFGTTNAPARHRMYVGGGFSEGDPVRFEIDGVTWAREL